MEFNKIIIIPVRILFFFLIITTLSFLLINYAPSSPVEILTFQRFGTIQGEDEEELIKEFALDRPFYIRYILWLKNAASLNFGRSVTSGESAIWEVFSRYKYTAILTLVASTIMVSFAFILALLQIYSKYKIISYTALLLPITLNSIPVFWLGLLLLYIFSIKLNLFPLSGGSGPLSIVLPSISLSTVQILYYTRLVKSILKESTNREYVEFAVAYGLGRRLTFFHYIAKPAIIPIINALGVTICILFSGAPIVETVFNWNGIGRLVVSAILARDYPVIQASITVIGATVLLISILIDIFILAFDPRFRKE